MSSRDNTIGGIDPQTVRAMVDSVTMLIHNNGNYLILNAIANQVKDYDKNQLKVGVEQAMEEGYIQPTPTQYGRGYAMTDPGREYAEYLDSDERKIGSISYPNTNEHLVLTVVERMDTDCTSLTTSQEVALTKSQVASALAKLYEKGLVDSAKREPPYDYWITSEGLEEMERLPQYGKENNIDKGLRQ